MPLPHKTFNGCPLPSKWRKTPQFGTQNLGLPMSLSTQQSNSMPFFIHHTSPTTSARPSKVEAVERICKLKGELWPFVMGAQENPLLLLEKFPKANVGLSSSQLHHLLKWRMILHYLLNDSPFGNILSLLRRGWVGTLDSKIIFLPSFF